MRSLKGRKISGTLTVDCANGVGGPKFSEFLKYVSKDKTGFDVKVVNDDVLRPEVLNLDVGSPLFSPPAAQLTSGQCSFPCAVRCRLRQDQAARPADAQARPRRSVLLL